MFANHPLTIIRYRDMQNDALRREAAAHQNGRLALRGRARREAAQPASPVVAASLPGAAPRLPWRDRATPALEPSHGA